MIGQNGTIEFEDEQSFGEIEIKFPEDTAEEQEELVYFVLIDYFWHFNFVKQVYLEWYFCNTSLA